MHDFLPAPEIRREKERERNVERKKEREREKGEREGGELDSLPGKPGAGIAESELHLHRRSSKAGRAHDAYKLSPSKITFAQTLPSRWSLTTCLLLKLHAPSPYDSGQWRFTLLFLFFFLFSFYLFKVYY